MKNIENLLMFLTKILGWISALCITLMMVQVFADVALKYFIKKPIVGTPEIVGNYYMLAAVFLPLALVEFRNAGVSVTLFYDMMRSDRVKRLIMVLGYIGQVIFFAMLAFKTGGDAMESYHKYEIVEAQVMIYVWPGFFTLPIGFGLATLVNILRIFQIMLDPDWEQIVE